jgi:hypothetical protein
MLSNLKWTNYVMYWGNVNKPGSVDSPLPGNDDVLWDATIQEVSQAVFPASPLRAFRGYISRPFNGELVSFRNEAVQCQCVN